MVQRGNSLTFNTMMSEQIGLNFADYMLKWSLLNEEYCILLNVLLKFVHNGPIDHKSILVQAWGNKP